MEKNLDQIWYQKMLKLDLEMAMHSIYITASEKRIAKRRLKHKKAKDYIQIFRELPK